MSHTDEIPLNELTIAHMEDLPPHPSKIPETEYLDELRLLQIELLKLQRYVKESGEKVVILFEGRDAAGKGGSIRRFTENLNPRGVRVNALLPGPVMTDMVRGMIERGAVSERNVVDRTPAGRFGEVADVADAVLLLAADESAFITGQAIAVDGGYTQWAASHEASRAFGG